MKLSYVWLSEFLDLKGKDPERLGDLLTLHTCELEEMIEKKIKNVVTGKVLQISPHPKTEKLRVAIVDTGKHKTRTILYGSTLLIKEGQIVPIALPGANLPKGIQIEEKEMQGILSQGMICIASELGMESDFLPIFPKGTPLGEPIEKIIPDFNTILFDIDNKSLTHRPDLWGHRGFAREIGAVFRKKTILQDPPEPKFPEKKGILSVQIKTPFCYRFCAVKMGNILVTPSPLAVQVRLETLDIKNISNFVDITNLVLLEYGQPMHVFDAEKVEGGLVVRQAKKGEKIKALDGKEYELREEDIVVADNKKALSIAGIIGGMDSAVSESTKEIIFESANFDATTIRKTSSRLGIHTESSQRFEKTLDMEACHKALFGAIKYAKELCPNAEIRSGLVDIRKKEVFEKKIELSLAHLKKIAGIEISEKEVKVILENLGFKVEENKEKMDIHIPSFRSTKDITQEEDIVEEVVRIFGFEKIPAILPDLPIKPASQNKLRKLEHQIREILSCKGFIETMNYSFVDEKDKEITGIEEYIKIKNPLTTEQTLLRKTLVSGILRRLESEVRTHKKIKLFELGKVFENLKESSQEKLHLSLCIAEMKGRENEVFFDLQKEVLSMLEIIGIDAEVRLSEKQKFSFIHPIKSCDLYKDEHLLGKIFVLHPEKNDIKEAIIVFAELDVEKLNSLKIESKKYKKISPYPPVFRDLSIILPKKTTFYEIKKAIKKVEKNIGGIEIFDEFLDDEKFGKDRKNISLHLTFLPSIENPIKEEEINLSFKNIVSALEESVGAVLRADFDKK